MKSIDATELKRRVEEMRYGKNPKENGYGVEVYHVIDKVLSIIEEMVR